MGKEYAGQLNAKGLKVAVIVSRFNSLLTDKLLDGCNDCLDRHGADSKLIDIYYVPGAFELPYLAAKLLEKKKHDAIICLGAVLRGQTPHFDFLSAEVTKGIAGLALSSGVPVIYGVITADTLEQGLERAGTKAGNKGWDAALSSIEMINLYKMI